MPFDKSTIWPINTVNVRFLQVDSNDYILLLAQADTINLAGLVAIPDYHRDQPIVLYRFYSYGTHPGRSPITVERELPSLSPSPDRLNFSRFCFRPA